MHNKTNQIIQEISDDINVLYIKQIELSSWKIYAQLLLPHVNQNIAQELSIRVANEIQQFALNGSVFNPEWYQNASSVFKQESEQIINNIHS